MDPAPATPAPGAGPAGRRDRASAGSPPASSGPATSSPAGPRHHPPEAAEQALVDPDDLGVLWVRLGYGGDLAGVVGLTWRTHEPPPSDEVLGLVRFAADAFHGAIRRRSVALLAEGQAEVFELDRPGRAGGHRPAGGPRPARAATRSAPRCVVATRRGRRLDLRWSPRTGDDALAPWFAALEPGLGNPYGQAVVTGEPVVVADARRRPPLRRPMPCPTPRSGRRRSSRSGRPRNGRTLAVVALLGAEPGAPIARPGRARLGRCRWSPWPSSGTIDVRRLAHQATHDPLTGVGNRAALARPAHLVLARARRTGRAVAVLFCDLDALQGRQRPLRPRPRRPPPRRGGRADPAAPSAPATPCRRTGGDEFVVVCEDLADADQAHAIAERVRDAIEDDAHRPRRGAA